MVGTARRTRRQRDPLEKYPASELLQYHHQMLLIRRFEEKVNEMYTKAKIGGYCHLNIGEEACIVGSLASITERDYILASYREHGHALVRGMDPKRVMAELFGKETGVAHGRGGSMHMVDTSRRFLGGWGIVGGHLAIATGAGFAIKYRGTDEVSVTFLGEGAGNIGAFHESLNGAAVWKLPVLFIVVNNGYEMGTAVDKTSAEPEQYKRAAAYRMPSERVDGMDVLAVKDAVGRWIEHVRKEQSPALIELVSYRFKGHSVIDPARYRPEEEVKSWTLRDPLLAFQQQLLDANILTEALVEAAEKEVEEVVEEAVVFADESPFPPISGLFDYVYDEGGAS